MTLQDTLEFNSKPDDMVTTRHQFDAFISYSHKADSELARVLQVRLERWARPWFSARTAKLFRDQASLTATPHLWTTIAKSLDKSRFLILLASTESAKSVWVPKEIAYWLSEGKCEDPAELSSYQIVANRVDRMMIVLTGGEIVWSHANSDFDWASTTALHPVLRKLPWQPLWTDLRWARERRAKQIEVDERFTEPLLKLLSPIRGKTPQELVDANDREQRRAVSLFRRLSIALAAALVVALATAWIAREQWAEAEYQVGVLALANGNRSIQQENDVGGGVLWYLKAMQAGGYKSDPCRKSANRLVNGWQRVLPARVIVDDREFAAKGKLCPKLSPDKLHIALVAKNSVAFWNITTGQRHSLTTDTTMDISDFCYSHDGTQVAIAAGRQVIIWDFPQKKTVYALDMEADVASICFSPDKKTLAVACSDGLFNLRDVRRDYAVLHSFNHAGSIRSMLFSANGDKLALVSGKLVNVVDSKTGELTSISLQCENEIMEIQQLPPLLLEGQVENAKDTYDFVVRDTSQVYLFSSSGVDKDQVLEHPYSPLAVTASNNGLFLISASQAGKSYENRSEGIVWSRFLRAKCEGQLPHDAFVLSVAVSPDGETVATGDADGIVKLWSIYSDPLGVPLKHSGVVWWVGFSLDGEHLLTLSDGMVYIWNAKIGRIQGRFTDERPPGKCIALQDRENGHVYYDPSGFVSLPKGSNSSQRTSIPVPEDLGEITINRDRTVIKMASKDESIEVFSTNAIEERVRVTIGNYGQISLCSEAYRYILSIDGGSWEVRDMPFGSAGKVLAGGSSATEITDLSICPSGTTIAIATEVGLSGNNGHVEIRDARSGGLRSILKGVAGRVHDLAFDCDGRTLVVSSVSGMQRSLQLFETTFGYPLCEDMHVGIGDESEVCISTNGDCMAISTISGSVCVFPIPGAVVDSATSMVSLLELKTQRTLQNGELRMLTSNELRERWESAVRPPIK